MGYIYFIGKFNLPIKVGNDAGDDAKEVFDFQTPLVRKVIPLGLEPKTYSLEGCCSIQLSYGTSPILECGQLSKRHSYSKTVAKVIQKT